MPRVYQPDHTSGIRRRLKEILLYFVTGAAVVSTSAVVLAIIATQLGDQDRTLVTVAWVVVVVGLLVAALGVMMTLVLYLRYRRRRADLDAAGAQAEGELLARIHLAPRGEG